jgi:plastocyanin
VNGNGIAEHMAPVRKHPTGMTIAISFLLVLATMLAMTGQKIDLAGRQQAGNVPSGITVPSATHLTDQAAVRPVPSGQVKIEGLAFRPATIIIAAGQTVTWTNRDAAPHTVTGLAGGWDLGTLNAGANRSHTFAQPGTYGYVCALHPNMAGEIIVK